MEKKILCHQGHLEIRAPHDKRLSADPAIGWFRGANASANGVDGAQEPRMVGCQQEKKASSSITSNTADSTRWGFERHTHKRLARGGVLGTTLETASLHNSRVPPCRLGREKRNGQEIGSAKCSVLRLEHSWQHLCRERSAA